MKPTEMDQITLKKALSYDPETGVFTWLAKQGSRGKGSTAGCVKATGYVHIRLNKAYYQAHRLAWLYMHGALPALEIDHVNGNPSDNRFANLREATGSQNQANKGLRRDNVSGAKGVSWNKHRNLWVAVIQCQGKQKYLGRFVEFDDAKAAYADACIDLFQDFARVG